jgi:hypothetical protein
MQHFFHGQNDLIFGATYVLFKNLPKVNNRTTGENSPNLVTLVGIFLFALFIMGMSRIHLANEQTFRSTIFSTSFILLMEGLGTDMLALLRPLFMS